MANRIAILIPYFGQWPVWIDFFIESCRWNRSIEWILFHDGPPPQNRCKNVRHVEIGFEAYKSLVAETLDIPFDPQDPYKLCEVRPALPLIHRDLVAGYDFVGFGDLDVVYGDIRRFYDDRLLASYDLFSAHSDRISGHFCLMRNCDELVNAFRQVPRWQKPFLSPENTGFDERAFYNLFVHPRRRLLKKPPLNSVRCYFREAYSTPGITDRMRWYWKDGRLRNEYYPHHEFMYLHFMSWHSNRWLNSQPGAPNGQAPWPVNPNVVRMDWRNARKDGFMISPQGIGPIE